MGTHSATNSSGPDFAEKRDDERVKEGPPVKPGPKTPKLWAKQICGGFQQDLIDMNLICVEKSCWEGAKMATKKTGHQCFRLFW